MLQIIIYFGITIITNTSKDFSLKFVIFIKINVLKICQGQLLLELIQGNVSIFHSTIVKGE